MAAFELIEDRNADYKTCKALSLIADNAWNGGIVIGAAKRAARGRSISTASPARSSATARRRLPARPTIRMGALAWLANLAADRGRPMTAGMVVITGSVITTVDIAPGERLDFTLDGVGERR